MKPEQQNIAIAKACGWTDCRLAIKGAAGGTRSATAHGKPPKRNYEANCPNYVKDLNAIWKAEETLSDEDEADYFDNLWRISEGYDIRATAVQRAEAFLRTLNLWQES